MNKHPLVLIVLDGWGHREDPEDNAIHAAHTPTWDALWRDAPHTLISGSGVDVGLPDGQMGNSEVGHMTLGAGRVIYQAITRIDKAIESGEFFENPAYTEAVDAALAEAIARTVRCMRTLGRLPGRVIWPTATASSRTAPCAAAWSPPPERRTISKPAGPRRICNRGRRRPDGRGPQQRLGVRLRVDRGQQLSRRRCTEPRTAGTGNG